MSDSEKFYVLVWDLKKKKPEFKIRFRHKIIETVIRPKLVFFALENRLSIFERNSLIHLLKLPIRSKEGRSQKERKRLSSPSKAFTRPTPTKK